MLKRFLAVLVCSVMLAVMLGIGIRTGRDAGRSGVDVTLEAAVKNRMGIGVVTCAGLLRVREAPSTMAYIITELWKGQEVIVLAEEAGFYRIMAVAEGEIVRGYVKMEYIEIIQEGNPDC